MVQSISYWKVLTRRKHLADESVIDGGEAKLRRVLGLYDLTALGVGSTLGAGVYVLAGQIAKAQAGPSVMISFAIAALASLLAGLCYAEFGARVPRAGSAYVYSYVCIGEFAAFVIGWNLILEYMIGTASVCRGISVYLDSLINGTLQRTFAEVAPMNVSFLASYFDFFAFGLVILFGVALAFGVETSAMANNLCTSLNIFILLFVIVAGSVKSNVSNWTIDVASVNRTDLPPGTDLGSGGYFPFGFAGTLKGAATCFYGFVGFDCIATTGEEVQQPRKNIPRSILYSLLIIFLCYFGVSTVLTLMVPYYLQDADAPLPYAFKQVGWTFAMWIVSIGGLLGLLASLFGALFPLPRVMYSMAQDGLLFRFLGRLSPRYRVPVVGSIFAAILTALIAGLFDLAQLVNLLSIGTLLAYSVVAISVTLLRYMDNEDNEESNAALDAPSGYRRHENGLVAAKSHLTPSPLVKAKGSLTENSHLTSASSRITSKELLLQLINFRRQPLPTALSARLVGTLITVFCVLSLAIGLILMQAYDALVAQQLWALTALVVLLVLMGLVLLSVCLQPREAANRVFRVPFVPLVPAVSIFVNVYLMLQLDVMTWIRFGVWMAVGLPIFTACWCMYDIRNPSNRNPQRLAFAKALHNPSPSCSPKSFHPKPEIIVESAESKDVDSPLDPPRDRKGSMVGQQNERSVKSLDEIMVMNEVSDDLLEVKCSNGDVFYVEDDKSNVSTLTLRDEEEFRNDSTASDTVEEEKTVIALLDNVLRSEEDDVQGGQIGQGGQGAAHGVRKRSSDSDVQPSVVQGTTVATVHSSSSNTSEEDLSELSEGSAEPHLSSGEPSLDSGNEYFKETKRVATELVDEVLQSDPLRKALEERSTRKDEAESDTMKGSDDPGSVIEPMKPALSTESPNSPKSPLHSEDFKSKLNRLIMHPPNHKSRQRERQKSDESPSPELPSDERPPLKHSRSEADVRHLILKVTEGCGIAADEAHSNGIPKAPKFDPILYKTINSISRPKDRPTLDKLLQRDEERPVLAVEKPKETAEPLDAQELFKRKLEALLKRGPLHRPHPPERPQSAGAALHESSVATLRDHRLSAKSEDNLNAPTSPAETLRNVRNALRPVQKGRVKL